MKKLFAIIGILAILSPHTSFAVYGLAQSADLERSSSQHFSRADNALLEPGAAFTVECWINMESVLGGGSAAYVIASKGTSTGSQRSFVFKVTNNGSDTISLSTQTSSNGSGYDGGTSVTWSATPTNGTWYHVAWIMNGSTEQYAVDGTQMGADQTSAISSLFNSTSAAGFGAENISGTPGDFFDGKISLCRMWQTARTFTQINDNKCNVLGSTANLSGEWTLDNTTNDNSGNSLTLTNNGSATFVADLPSLCSSGAASTPTFIGIIES